MGPMRRVMVGFEAPNAPVEAAWARLRYPTSTQAKFANDSLEGDGRSTRVDLAAALRLLDQNGQSDLAAGFSPRGTPTTATCSTPPITACSGRRRCRRTSSSIL